MRYTKINLLFFILVFGILSLIINGAVFSQTQYDIAVTATVPPQQSDFQFEFTSLDGQSTVNQNTTLSYQVTYGAKSTAGVNTNNTIIADFSNDLSPDNSHVLDYVIGSATNAYGGSPPVVDLNNRTITWTVPNLPSGTTNQTVTFKLKTNSNYTGPNPVNFITRAKMSNQYHTLPDQTVSQTYQFGTGVSVTTAPASSPTSTPKPSTVPNPTPTVAANPLKITSVEFTNISKSQADISIGTSKPTKLTISYGKTPATLFQKVSTNQFSSLSYITLENLTSDTTYYLQITVIDANGNIGTSEIFTFHTARDSATLNLENAAAVIVSGGNTVFSKVIEKNNIPGFAILTDNTDYEFSYTPANTTLSSLEIIVKNSGQNTPFITVNGFQKKPGLFISHLRSQNLGSYEIFVKAKDANGNLVQTKIVNLKVIKRLSVYSAEDNSPLGDARVFLYYYNSKNQKYEPISKDLFGNIINPQFTNKMGELNIILPEGKYMAQTSSFWHKSETTKFILGPKNGEEFPRIYLKKDLFNLSSFIINLKNFLVDSFANLMETSNGLSSSIRLFNTMALLTLIFSFISLLFFLLKTHINANHLPAFFLFHMHLLINKHRQKYIYGVIKTVDNKPISKASVELLDKNTDNILTHTMSNKTGRFQIRNNYSSDSYKILVEKDGYQPAAYTFSDMDLSSNGLKITLNVGDSKLHPKFGVKLLEHIGGSLFESALLISIILEVLFLYLFGFAKTLPFFILSMFSIMLWIFYLKEHNGYK